MLYPGLPYVDVVMLSTWHDAAVLLHVWNLRQVALMRPFQSEMICFFWTKNLQTQKPTTNRSRPLLVTYTGRPRITPHEQPL